MYAVTERGASPSHRIPAQCFPGSGLDLRRVRSPFESTDEDLDADEQRLFEVGFGAVRSARLRSCRLCTDSPAAVAWTAVMITLGAVLLSRLAPAMIAFTTRLCSLRVSTGMHEAGASKPKRSIVWTPEILRSPRRSMRSRFRGASLAGDPPMAPARILSHDPQHQLPTLLADFGRARGAGACTIWGGIVG